jgi:hypothetical protein
MKCESHVVCKFFSQYRELYEALLELGVGEKRTLTIDANFPPTLASSALGIQMNEEQLQDR